MSDARPGDSAPTRENEVGGSSHVPVLLLALAFCVLGVFQTTQLISDREMLANLKLAQESSIQEGGRIRHQLDSLATRTAQLTNDGNPRAKAIVDDMRRQGIITATPRP
jgi:uncharacterized protein YoxC